MLTARTVTFTPVAKLPKRGVPPPVPPSYSKGRALEASRKPGRCWLAPDTLTLHVGADTFTQEQFLELGTSSMIRAICASLIQWQVPIPDVSRVIHVPEYTLRAMVGSMYGGQQHVPDHLLRSGGRRGDDRRLGNPGPLTPESLARAIDSHVDGRGLRAFPHTLVVSPDLHRVAQEILGSPMTPYRPLTPDRDVWEWEAPRDYRVHSGGIGTLSIRVGRTLTGWLLE